MENKKILDIPLKKEYKKEVNVFLKNKNAVMANVKLNWGLILGFSLVFFAFSFLCLFGGIYKNNIVISGILAFKKNGSEWIYSQNMKSENSVLSYSIFGIPGMLIMLGFSLNIIKASFTKDVRRKTINFWTTLPFSRNELFFSKYIFVIFASFLVFAPTFLLIIIFSAAAIDANHLFGNVLFFCIQFFLFISFINSIFFLTSNIFVDKMVFAYIINISIILGIFFVDVSTLIVYVLGIDSEGFDIKDANVRIRIILWISKINLVVNPIYFCNASIWFEHKTITQSLMNSWGPALPGPSNDINCYIAGNVLPNSLYTGINKIKASIFPMLTLGFCIGSVFLNNYIFSKKDLNI